MELQQERAKNQKGYFEEDSYQKQLLEVKQENQRLNSAYKQCLADKNQAERDLDITVHALHQSKFNEKESISLVVRKERMAFAEAKKKLDAALQRETALRIRCSDIEEQLEETKKQLEQSEARNSCYEKDHGLTDAVRYQKKLEADIRRRDYDLKQMKHKLGVEIDRRVSLSKLCGWLKDKANLGPEFVFDDEMKKTLECEENRLQNENLELLRQVEALEG